VHDERDSEKYVITYETAFWYIYTYTQWYFNKCNTRDDGACCQYIFVAIVTISHCNAIFRRRSQLIFPSNHSIIYLPQSVYMKYFSKFSFSFSHSFFCLIFSFLILSSANSHLEHRLSCTVSLLSIVEPKSTATNWCPMQHRLAVTFFCNIFV
jgi:hypothetical protein